jgi:hypothetical protein
MEKVHGLVDQVHTPSSWVVEIRPTKGVRAGLICVTGSKLGGWIFMKLD